MLIINANPRKVGRLDAYAKRLGEDEFAGGLLITEAQGIPLAVILTGANRNDVTQLLPLVEAIPPTRGERGRLLSKPRIIQADRGYDHDKYRRPLYAQGIKTEIARRNTPHGSGLGTPSVSASTLRVMTQARSRMR